MASSLPLRAQAERLRQHAGTARLRRKDATRASVLPNGVVLIEHPDLDAANGVATPPHAAMSCVAPAPEIASHGLRRAAVDRAPIRLPTLLLVGTPGVIKPSDAQRMACHLGVPEMTVEDALHERGFGVTSPQAGRGTTSGAVGHLRRSSGEVG